ncbi:hypothetical protein F4553_005248 [Allocatelliglobosispora scoriae]|uniref:Uncharacterized protein n=1 Tax=Allocatelliglobosispora scoriae TaxID=643052 RepID=A0A841BXK0_9ACTN|nr:hypothetical protein [Allocatelliglobosispora scoriae]MBB5871869.1 hypothetical protein [Allocatelliglobosispora scoriae]
MIPAADAERALAEVKARREQAVTGGLLPGWYWPALGALMLVFVASIESKTQWIIIAGSVFYAAALGALLTVILGRARLQVRNNLLGLRGGLTIAAFTLTLVAIGVGLGFLLDAQGLRWPATIACVPVALGLTFGGPVLMQHLRRMMISRPMGGEL